MRLAVDLSEERREEFFDACIEAGEVALGEAVHNVGDRLGAGPHRDFNRFLEEVEAVAGVSVLSSWNFRHMVNFWRIQRYNEVNLQWGYVPLDIRSPKELENEE